MAMVVLVSLTLTFGCGDDEVTNPSDNVTLPAELLGIWSFASGTENGIPYASYAEISFTDTSTSQQIEFIAGGKWESREYYNGVGPVYTRSGICYDDDSLYIKCTLKNGTPDTSGYSGCSWIVTGSTLTLSASYVSQSDETVIVVTVYTKGTNNVTLPVELLGIWNFTSATENGVPYATYAEISYTDTSTSQQLEFIAGGTWESREYYNGLGPVYTRSGTCYDDDSLYIKCTLENGTPDTSGYIGYSWTVAGSTLTITTSFVSPVNDTVTVASQYVKGNNNVTLPAELLGIWNFNSATENGVPYASFAEISFTDTSTSQQLEFIAGGTWESREYYNGSGPVYTRNGICYVDDSLYVKCTLENGTPDTSDYIGYSWTVADSTLTIMTSLVVPVDGLVTLVTEYIRQ